MFRKEFKVKTNVKSKNSEKRKFIADVSNYYHFDQLLLFNLIGKSEFHKIKVICHDETIVTVFNFDNQPLFFELNKVIIPSVYCLWFLFDILPSFSIFEETVTYINNGSDLMIPGIIVKKPLNEKSYGIFNKKELYTINTNTNRAPVAIGLTNMDAYDMFMAGRRGKALNIIHCQGDYLWAFGKKNVRPQINWIEDKSLSIDEEIIVANERNIDDKETNEIENEFRDISVCSSDVDNEESSTLNISEIIESNEIMDESRNILDILIQSSDKIDDEINNMNKLLETCFLHAIKCSLKDKSLPVTLNMFYANYVRRYCPDGVILEIKKTSFKRFGVFMKAMQDEDIIKLKTINKGVEAIDFINRNHEKLKFIPTLIFQDEKQNISSENEYVFPQIDDIYFITDKVYTIFKFHGYKKSDVIYPKDIKSIITDYVNKHNLNGLNKEMVTLDNVLRDCCLNSKETITELSWKTLFERFNKNMTPGFILQFPGESVIKKNSKRPKIKIQSFNRSNKMVTRIEGEDQFCIDSKKLCNYIQQTIGCSCGLVTDKSGLAAIQAQGDQIKRVTQILTGHYKVPSNFIETVPTKTSK